MRFHQGQHEVFARGSQGICCSIDSNISGRGVEAEVVGSEGSGVDADRLDSENESSGRIPGSSVQVFRLAMSRF